MVDVNTVLRERQVRSRWNVVWALRLEPISVRISFGRVRSFDMVGARWGFWRVDLPRFGGLEFAAILGE